jgi:hypothetical protein
MSIGSISYTPSCSSGNIEEHRGGFAEQMSIIFIGVTSRTVLTYFG